MNVRPIAFREYYLLGDPETIFRIEVYPPNQIREQGPWHCEVKIIGAPPGLDTMVAGGTDSYQALICGLKMLETMVNALNKKVSLNLRYLEDSGTDLFVGLK